MRWLSLDLYILESGLIASVEIMSYASLRLILGVRLDPFSKRDCERVHGSHILESWSACGRVV